MDDSPENKSVTGCSTIFPEKVGIFLAVRPPMYTYRKGDQVIRSGFHLVSGITPYQTAGREIQSKPVSRAENEPYFQYGKDA